MHYPQNTKAGWRPAQWASDAGVSRSLVFQLLAAGKLHSVQLVKARIILTSPRAYLDSLADDEAA